MNINKYGYDFLKEKYLSGMSMAAIGRKYHCAPNWLSKKLRKDGITPPKIGVNSVSGKRYNHNDSVFETINTEEKAYWLGFLYADGSCHPTRGLVVVSLAEKDEDHLDSFRKFISPENKLEYLNNTKAYRLSIYDKKIHKDLINLGCIPNKSLILQFPDFLDKEVTRHFIRGYFDGDGCVCISNGRLYFSLLGTFSFLNSVQTIFKNDLATYTATKLSKKGNIFVLNKAKKLELDYIFNYLYKDATVFLSRKYNKFKAICRARQ